VEDKLAVIEQELEVPSPSLHAVGITATEIAEATKQIGGFLREKLRSLEAEHNEMQDALSIATQNGWETKALGNAAARLGRQVTYYGKLLLAVDAGYTIVPNMPCDQFAIRTSRTKPRRQQSSRTETWQAPVRVPDEKEQILEAGEGRYESPSQLVSTHETFVKMPEGKSDLWRVDAWAADWSPIEFPFAAARPVVMTATQAAMALKLFDRIGIVPQRVQNDADPIVLGQIVLREKRRAERVVSFLIAWHLDLRTL
jgi:hypothetical protein